MNNATTAPIHPARTEDAALGWYGVMGDPVAPLGPVPVALGTPWTGPDVEFAVADEAGRMLGPKRQCRFRKRSDHITHPSMT